MCVCSTCICLAVLKHLPGCLQSPATSNSNDWDSSVIGKCFQIRHSLLFAGLVQGLGFVNTSLCKIT